jgi:thioredoxin reductase (NADPH)
LRASKVMQERVLKNTKIEVRDIRSFQVHWKTQAKSAYGDGKLLTGLKIDHMGVEKDLPVNGLFYAIGHEPNTSFLDKNCVKCDNEGYVVQVNHTETSVEGLFAAGDVCDKRYRQAVTAAGDGCRAALDCEKYLAEKLNIETA